MVIFESGKPANHALTKAQQTYAKALNATRRQASFVYGVAFAVVIILVTIFTIILIRP